MSGLDDDSTASEYALGTLDAQERVAADARRATDAGFDRAVGDWEKSLAPLVESVGEVDAPAHVWPAILARITGLSLGTPAEPSRQDAGRVIVLARQVSRWRQVAALTTALAAAFSLWIVIGPIGNVATGKPQVIAVLFRGGEEPAYMLRVSQRGESVAVRPVAAHVPEGKSYELWVIDPSIGPPRSLGTIGDDAPLHRIPSGIAPDVVARATYAVTLEPVGGSPTGKPSGAPIFVGHAMDVP